MLIVNFKIYKETFGDKAIELAEIVKKVGEKYHLRTIITASALDAVRIAKNVRTEVWLQNIDEFTEGKYTGWISAWQAMDLGIKGSLLNHSEHQIPKGKIAKILKNKPKDFEVMCCVKRVGQLETWTNKLNPEWVLFEPPELIASKEDSVATKDADLIKRAAIISNNLVVGAGVKSGEDVKISLKMGAKGVGLSSAFVLSSDPEALLEDIAKGFDGIILK